MASKDTITFSKVKTYTLPEFEWDSSSKWYADFEKRVTGFNSLGNSKTIRIDSKWDSQSKLTKEAR